MWLLDDGECVFGAAQVDCLNYLTGVAAFWNTGKFQVCFLLVWGEEKAKGGGGEKEERRNEGRREEVEKEKRRRRAEWRHKAKIMTLRCSPVGTVSNYNKRSMYSLLVCFFIWTGNTMFDVFILESKLCCFFQISFFVYAFEERQNKSLDSRKAILWHYESTIPGKR